MTSTFDIESMRRTVDALNRDIEEKIYQMSQIRLVAETLASCLAEGDFFQRTCSFLNDIFNARVTCLFWNRKRQPTGWWLEAWRTAEADRLPDRQIISPLQEGVLGWINRHRKALYLTNVSGEMIFQMWGFPPETEMSLAILPLTASERHQGMLVVIDPHFIIPPFKLQYHLDILSGLLQSGINNRLLYSNLKDSEEEYRDLFENASTMALVVYPDGVIRECNRTFAKAMGLKESPAGMMLMDVVKEERERRFEECWRQLLEDGEVRNVPMLIHTANNTVREFQLSGNARVNSEGFPLPYPDVHAGCHRTARRRKTAA